jgi:hypothetical protein
LSLSASPALGPWGIPFELVEDVWAAAPPDVVVWLAGVVAELDELEELEPHAATPNAASNSSTAANRRGDRVFFLVISSLLCRIPDGSAMP